MNNVKTSFLIAASLTSFSAMSEEILINTFEGTIGSPTDSVTYYDEFGAVHSLGAPDANFSLASGNVWQISWNASAADNYQRVSFGGIGGTTSDFSSYSEVKFDVLNTFGNTIDFGFRLEDSSGEACNLEQYGYAAAQMDTMTLDLATCSNINLSEVAYIRVYALTWASLQGSVEVDSVRGVSSDTPPDGNTPSYRTEGGSMGAISIFILSAFIWLRRRR